MEGPVRIEVAVCSIESALSLKEAVPQHRVSNLCVTLLCSGFSFQALICVNTLSVDVVVASFPFENDTIMISTKLSLILIGFHTDKL